MTASSSIERDEWRADWIARQMAAIARRPRPEGEEQERPIMIMPVPNDV
jgi:hypothetical protein